MIASASTIDRRYPGLLHSAFLRRGILTASAPGGETRASAGLLTLSGRAFGLGEKPLIVQAAGGPGESHAFLRWLIERGRIEAPADLFPRLPVHPQTVKSHRLVELDGHLVLERILFDCGFHAAS